MQYFEDACAGETGQREDFRDVGIAPNAWGRPEVIWSERGRALRDKLGAGEGHVTLTDEAGLVVAVAVLMRRTQEQAP